ncbi:hypothetical protein LAZ40_06670 [Cereibacter sphaeroides]|uniref:hypothetical protein n=1 Tax=Cereibacter sphaeroides TaxID=1063 RepID=UPI001F36D0C9|nr:hypothetical protein [Cereibacter sphaeroides]MCE6958729.1 hypothetical protein [Cereibacter sphaeroides]MCE6973397.1 hypothetical protein [Cereibacter sphaeroides]
MKIDLTRTQVTALAKLDVSGLSHLQRIDRIARILGFENQASLMSRLKTDEAFPPAALSGEAPVNAPALREVRRQFPVRPGASLDALNLSGAEEWKRGLAKNGLFLFVGPCGSGKTTTLNASLLEIHDRREPSVGSLFLRDQVSAHIAIDMTKRVDVVLGTMHAGSLQDAFSRLRAMQVPLADLRRALRGVITQYPLREGGEWRAPCELVIFDRPEDVDRALNGEVFWTTMREDAARMKAEGLLTRETVASLFGETADPAP